MSSSDVAISVDAVSKSYTIRHNTVTARTTLADALVQRVKHPRARTEKEQFWALHDISIEVREGEVVGIIGRNGAGKSTLLKILSQITVPTSGQIDIYGRIGSLLEVGTGFHPELTGRENVYLNGAILGMKRSEITRQFDAIVDFAGVEQFLDTPVKRYSSGMYVRLAFAVAAHLEHRDPARRRSAVGRRWRVPAEVLGQDARRRPRRPHHPFRQPRDDIGRLAVHARDPPPTRSRRLHGRRR